VLIERFGGDPASVWTGAATGPELVDRIGALPGFGAQKAKIFAALLGKQFSVQPRGWRQVSEPFGEKNVFRSVADVTDDPSLQKVRAFKKEQKAAAKQSG